MKIRGKHLTVNERLERERMLNEVFSVFRKTMNALGWLFLAFVLIWLISLIIEAFRVYKM